MSKCCMYCNICFIIIRVSNTSFILCLGFVLQTSHEEDEGVSKWRPNYDIYVLWDRRGHQWPGVGVQPLANDVCLATVSSGLHHSCRIGQWWPPGKRNRMDTGPSACSLLLQTMVALVGRKDQKATLVDYHVFARPPKGSTAKYGLIGSQTSSKQSNILYTLKTPPPLH